MASPTAFTVLRVAGTGYLGWLAVTLSAVFAALYIGWSTCYVLALVRIGHLVRNARVRSRVEGITGAALMLLAVRLAKTAGP